MITTFLIQRTPEFIQKRIPQDKEFAKIVRNINWLMVEKVFNTLFTFFVGVVVVRYLGPEKYGKYSYVNSFISLFLPLATLGLDEIVIRELVKNKKNSNTMLGNSFTLKLIGVALLVISALSSSLIFHRNNTILTVYVLILVIGYSFRIFDVIDFWFRSQVRSKYSALSRIFAIIITAILQLLFVMLGGSLTIFIWIASIHLILNAIFYIYFYQKYGGNIKEWHFGLKHWKALLSSSWPLIVSGFAIAVYMKIDQIIINSLLGHEQLGYYSTAVKLSEAGYFLPTIVAVSVYPAIINAKRKSQSLYNSRLRLLYGSFIWLSILISLLVSSLSRPIITIIFGNDFLPAAKVLSVHIWSFVFVSLGIATSRQLFTEDKTLFHLTSTLMGAIISIIANLILVPSLGIMGAAWSNVITQGFANFVSLFFFKRTRNILKQILQSVNLIKQL